MSRAGLVLGTISFLLPQQLSFIFISNFRIHPYWYYRCLCGYFSRTDNSKHVPLRLLRCWSFLPDQVPPPTITLREKDERTTLLLLDDLLQLWLSRASYCISTPSHLSTIHGGNIRACVSELPLPNWKAQSRHHKDLPKLSDAYVEDVQQLISGAIVVFCSDTTASHLMC